MVDNMIEFLGHTKIVYVVDSVDSIGCSVLSRKLICLAQNIYSNTALLVYNQ